MGENDTLEKILDAVRTGAAVAGALTPFLIAAVAQYNNIVASWRALGMSDEEIVKHIGASEAKLDSIVARLAEYTPQRHPDDKG